MCAMIQKLRVREFDIGLSERETMWGSVAKLAQSQADASTAMTKLSTTVEDYVHNQDKIISDHEQRIRTLERK